MANVVRNRRDAKLTIKDGTGTPQTFTVDLMEADFTYNEPERAELIAQKDRKGNLNHFKRPDPYNGPGKVSFSSRYVSKDIKFKIAGLSIFKTTAVANDGIPASISTMNLEYAIYDEDEITVVETHKLYNVAFDPAKCVFKEGDESDTMSFEGQIMGKVGPSTTLGAAYTSGGSTLTVASTTGLAVGIRIQVGTTIFRITGITNTTTLAVVAIVNDANQSNGTAVTCLDRIFTEVV